MGLSEAAWILFVWGWAFVLGAVEIEIEGAHGWAERLPTWYRRRGPVATVYGWCMGGRPLTGYHVFAALVVLLPLHLPYFRGDPWSAGAEAHTVAVFLVLTVFADYLWFVLNPAYTVRRFRRGNVWWFRGPWLGPFPGEYILGLGLSCLLVVASAHGALKPLYEHLEVVLGCAVLTVGAIAAAPLYHRWYRQMRRPGSDDRPITPIAPPP
jgi:hypothetical protein